MSKRLAILCPGQGAQHARMFELFELFELRDSAAHGAALAEHWLLQDSLGMPLAQALTNPAHLYANRIAQPLIVAASLTAWEAVRNMLPQSVQPALVAGYSIGELTAYAVAGSLSPQDALVLAAQRAAAMDACRAPDRPQAMLAVSGLALPLLREMLQEDALYMAIETGEDSAIVGGLHAQADVLRRLAEQRGARAIPLPVEVASHTPLMGDAVAPFLDDMKRRRFLDPRIPVVCGISAENVRNHDRAMQTLARQLSETVLWRQCMDNCAEAGITIALELGPGTALSRMLSQRHPQIACRSVCEFRSAAGVAGWIERHFD